MKYVLLRSNYSLKKFESLPREFYDDVLDLFKFHWLNFILLISINSNLDDEETNLAGR